METAIICVDDEKSVLLGIEQQLIRTLKGKEYILELAQSGEEALDIVDDLLQTNVNVSIIITDQMMPGIKGSELINIISEKSPDTKCIMLTGFSNHQIEDIVNENLVKVMSKPWDVNELTSIVNNLLQ